MNLTRKPRGFTLVETLAVVAIVGLSVGIAVPSYCKYASQAKQAQAKSTLGAVFIAERIFAVQNASFTACLGDIGVKSSLESPTAYYAFGFNDNLIPATGCGSSGNDSCFGKSYSPWVDCTSHGDGDVSYPASLNMDSANATVPDSVNLYPSGPAPASFVTNTTFLAMAVGNISSCNSSYDKWTIDQNQNLVNEHPAL